jgi:cell division protein FtsQ
VLQKLKNISLWIVLAVYLSVVLGFVAERRRELICNDLTISISNEGLHQFVHKEDIKQTLERSRYKYIGKQVDSVNTFIAEELIAKNPAIRQAAVYTSIDGRLNVDIEQRRPIVKVINKRYQSYFIDDKGGIVPMSYRYAAFTLVANGNINEPFNVSKGGNIFPTKKDSILRPNAIYDIFKLAKFLDDDDFWRAQIEQVFVNDHNDLILVPRVGSHAIVLGKSDNLEYKFAKLKAMYRAFNQIGWNQYKTINLKYSNQVVCTKR